MTAIRCAKHCVVAESIEFRSLCGPPAKWGTNMHVELFSDFSQFWKGGKKSGGVHATRAPTLFGFVDENSCQDEEKSQCHVEALRSTRQ